MRKLLGNLTLELSAKAFKDDSDGTLRAVCSKMLEQWKPLREEAQELSVMLWLADGSEILDYAGNLDDTFEWAYWIGTANNESKVAGDTRDNARNLSQNPVKYMENPPSRSYGWVKRLTATLKELGGPGIRIGATFDPGPEFAKSEFKRSRHTEINRKLMGFNGCFIKAASRLDADTRRYATFPDGIPQGTPFGTFLGRQFARYAQDLGFDYLWLSNGIGFGFETWRVQGVLFDGKRFHPEDTEANRKGLMEFWDCLCAKLKGIPVETRGSNMSAGIEMASDAAPIKDIYKLHHPAAPVNSPWAALNYDTGTELAGWMSHIAELPTERIPFRYYIHDPWWINSPWLDRYGREPWDIYLPLSVSTIDGAGKARPANSLAFLSVDNSYGEMPDQVPQEVIPHMLEALRDKPDQAGPLVWLYPFDEYHETVFGADRHPDAVFAEDAFIAASIQNGLPLNTVISSSAFMKRQAQGSLVLAPMSAMKGVLLKAVEKFTGDGGKVLFYGPAEHADPSLLKKLGLSLTDGMEGEVSIETSMEFDSLESGGFAKAMTVHPQFCGGALRETATNVDVLAEAVQGSGHRAIAVANGRLVWVRTLLTSQDDCAKWGRILPAAPTEQFPVERLLRLVLSRFGFHFVNRLHRAGQLVPRFNISRSRNAYFLSGFCPDTTVEIAMRMPLGAPVLHEMETFIRDGKSLLRMPRSWHRECHLFVESCDDGVISAKERTVGYPGLVRRIEYIGFENATVHFLPPPEAQGGLEASLNGERLDFDAMDGDILTFRKISGALQLVW